MKHFPRARVSASTALVTLIAIVLLASTFLIGTPSARAAGGSPPHVVSGSSHTCALTIAGTAECSGRNDNGEIGDGTGTTRDIPTAVVMPGGVTFSSMALGGLHSCALATTGDAYCWGYNGSGQLGDGTQTQRNTPGPVTMPGGVTFNSIAAGDYYSCALTTTGDAYCWGSNDAGQLGDGTTTLRSTPVAVTMPGGVTFTSIAAGSSHTCAVSTDGAAYCWGYNPGGELGNGNTTDSLIPVPVTMPGGVRFTSVSVSPRQACALSTLGRAYCWGINFEGELGNGTNTHSNTPIAVHLPVGVALRSLTISYYHACGVSLMGAAYCWGWNADGELGDGTTTDRNTPVPVTMPAGINFASVALGFRFSCALATTGESYCWGGNAGGQFGDGTTAASVVPEIAGYFFPGMVGSTVEAVVDPTLTFQVSGHTGACNGVAPSASASSSAIQVSLDHINLMATGVSAQDIVMTTNAAGGFTVYARYTGPMSDGIGNSIADVATTNASPGAFPAVGTSAFGYTTDAALSGVIDRFTNPSAKWAAMTTSNAEVIHAEPGSALTTTACIAYQVGASSDMAAGDYSTTVIYTAVPVF